MSEQNLHRPVARRANINDFEKIYDIDRNVYDGTDYLPALFYEYFHQPGYALYVLELDKSFITFAAFRVMDGGKTLASLAGRVRPSFRKKHFGPMRNPELRQKIYEDFPNVVKIIFVIERQTALKIINEGQGYAGYTWKTLSFGLTASDISKRAIRRSSTSKHLKYTNAVRLLTSGDTIQNLLRRYAVDYIPHGAGWVPGPITSEELKEIIAANVAFISSRGSAHLGSSDRGAMNEDFTRKEYDEMELTAFSYQTQIQVKNGNLAVIFYYGEFDDLFDHLVSHLEHLSKAFHQALTVQFHIPIGIDSSKVNAGLEELKLTDKFDTSNNEEWILGWVELNAVKASL